VSLLELFDPVDNCTVTEAICQACEGIIDAGFFRSRLNQEDIQDIESGAITIPELRSFAMMMRDRLERSSRPAHGAAGHMRSQPQEVSDMRISECFKGAYLRAADLKDRTVKVQIDSVTLESVGDDQDEKPVVSFLGKDKGLVLNKTNATLLSERFGDDTDGWTGKSIELTTERVSFNGRLVDGIRVKVPTAAPAQEFDDDIPF